MIDALNKFRENLEAALMGHEPPHEAGSATNWRTVGICNLVPSTAGFNKEIHRLLSKWFEEWPEFSGDNTYPVPSTESDWDAGGMFNFADDVWIGEYGQLRMELARFIIGKVMDKVDSLKEQQ